MWEEWSQEEARIVAREEMMGNEYQDLIAHTKKIKKEHIGQLTLKSSIFLSNQKFEIPSFEN